MKLTPALKAWLREHAGVADGATDDDYRKAAAVAMTKDATDKGYLSPEKMVELCRTKADEAATAFNDTLKGIKELLTELKSEAKGSDGADTKATDGAPEGTKATETETKKPTTKKTPRKMSDLEKAFVGMSGTPEEYDGEKTFDVRVKGAYEQYSGTKTALAFPARTVKGHPHPLAGQPVKDFTEGGAGRVLESASERDKAIAGAYAKFLVNAARTKSRNLAFSTLPEHDRELLCYAMQEMKWGGATDGGDRADIRDRKLTPTEQKALIDDATSGGLEAAPIVFDDMVIQAPLLNGELYPLVNTIPLDRGRRVEGVATGTVTSSWGGVDDTAISLFNTASYVTAFDTTIFRWEGAIKIGLDFLSDTPIDFGAHITAQYGERLLEDLDDVIAAGNGTTQPEGVIVKSGTTSVTWSGATSLGNYESLRFGVAKPEHKANMMATAVFVGTETSYQRARAIPVGASDARRLGGMDYASYSWMGHPYKINESLTNAQVFYAILGRYRMYRRRGLTVRTSTEGDTLIRANEMLISVTARYGGQLERGACAAVTTDAPA